jgi:hypothetical protein
VTVAASVLLSLVVATMHSTSPTCTVPGTVMLAGLAALAPVEKAVVRRGIPKTSSQEEA